MDKTITRGSGVDKLGLMQKKTNTSPKTKWRSRTGDFT